MGASNRNQIIDEIKSRCNIVDVIGSVVSLKKKGANYQGLCPFHNEKTPSFVVSETKQLFTCFGCHESGDVIQFVMKYYNLTFVEALEKLAAQCGMNVDDIFRKGEKKDIYYEVNREAARFFFKALRATDNPGLKYILGRGLSKETLHDFGIGYADESWDSLYKYLKGKGYDEKVMIKLGLVSKSAKGKCYDRFRNRVIFPIQNTAGKVIGFGGRALGDDMPKYLNSPETPVFSKKNNLYALNVTKNHINQSDQAILVEGYMDVISLYQGGVKNVSASLGTALTENQSKLLKRYTKNIVLSYDADSAGINAAIRGSEILHKEGCKVKVLHITDGKDPDDFIKAKGKEAYYNLVSKANAAIRGSEILHKEGCKVKVLHITDGKDPDDFIKAKGKEAYYNLVSKATPYGDFRIGQIAKKYKLDTTEGRVDFLKEAAKFLNGLSPVEADIYIEKIAKNYHISAGALRTEMGLEGEKKTFFESKTTDSEEINSDITKIEKTFIRMLLLDAKYFDEVKLNEDIFVSESGINIFREIQNIYEQGEEIDVDKLIDNLEPTDVEVIKRIEKDARVGENLEQILSEGLKAHEKDKNLNREQELFAQLAVADEEGNQEEIIRITEAIMKLQETESVGGK